MLAKNKALTSVPLVVLCCGHGSAGTFVRDHSDDSPLRASSLPELSSSGDVREHANATRRRSLSAFPKVDRKFQVVIGNDVLVQLEQGCLSGKNDSVVIGNRTCLSFKGIPYAAPPVGKLRFKDPQPPLFWEGVRNATQHGSKCPQVDTITKVYLPGSEDCLFLNVYTPNLSPDTALPVMFYIHGGGFTSGSGDDDEFGPDFLVSKDVVVVTINYRLGALGFLCMDTKDVPGNAGLKDQLAALKWVRKNIAKFGGDPDNVTIFGQSAGGASVAYHSISPLSNGYFKRGIVMSGSPYNDWSISYKPARRALVLGQLVSNYTANETNLLDILQSVAYENLLKAKPTVLTSEEIIINLIKMNINTPVIEKDNGQEMFLPMNPADLLNTGRVNEVDLMFGYTNHEALLMIEALEKSLLNLTKRYPEMLVPVKILITSDPDLILNISDEIRQFYFGNQEISVATMKEMVDFVSNASFAYDIQRFAGQFPNPGYNSRYFYKFSCYSSLNVNSAAGLKYNLTGAAHMDDLRYIFYGNSLNLTIKENTPEYEMINLVTTLFTNFAKCGNPTPDSSLGVTWPIFDNENLAYVDISRNLTVSSAPDAEAMQFWQKILAFAGIEF